MKNDTKSTSLKRSPRKRIHFSDDSYTVDNTGQSTSLESQPENLAEIPYWQLRNINRTIQDGGFLTNNIFIHKKIWSQTGTKFSGVTAKNAAFEIILQCVLNNVEGLYLCDDDDSLALAQTAFSTVEDELVALQNQLSKPFPYIKERGSSSTSQNDSMSNGSGHGSTHGSGHGSVGSPSPAPNNVPSTGAPNTAAGAGGSEGIASYQGSPNSEKRNNNRSFATMVSSLGKHMKKYAEVSYQRLVVALPNKMTAQDMRDYTAIVSRVCEKCQILDTWFRFLLQTKQCALSAQGESMECTPPVSAANSEPPSPTAAMYARSHLPPAIKTHIRTEFTEAAVLHIDSMLVTLQTIASVVRSVVCEILLRDIEALVERYLLKTRKSFARMYWDDDVEYVD
eukprot:gene22718-28874_t